MKTTQPSANRRKSVRSRVTNVSEHLQTPLTVLEFINLVFNHILEMYEDAKIYEITEEDIKKINELVEKKYSTWEWNFGYSPEYNFSKSVRTEGGTLEVAMFVENGVIQRLRFYGDFFTHKDITEIEEAFVSIPHKEEEIKQVLSRYNLDDYFFNINQNDILSAMF